MSFCGSPRYHPWKLFKRKNVTSLPNIVADIPLLDLYDETEQEYTDIVALCCSFSPNDACIIACQHTPASYVRGDTTFGDIPCAFISLWDIEDEASEENVLLFTYSAMPHPSFSPCGNIYSCILNNSRGCLEVCGSSEDEDNCKYFEKKTLKCLGGNLHGRTKCLSITHQNAVTITNVRMIENDLNNCIVSFWNVSNEFTLRHLWTRTVPNLFKEIRLHNITLQACVFSPSSKFIGILLSNGLLAIIETKNPENTIQVDLFALLQCEGGTTSSYQHPVIFAFCPNGSDAVISAGYKRSFGIIKAQNFGKDISFKLLPDIDDSVKHMGCSKNGFYISICSSNGNVYIYAVRPNYELLHTLSRKTENIQANFSSFSSSSEELAVSYSDGLVSIWQLPRILNLKEICRLKICTLMTIDRIQCLDIPKKLIDFLSFN